MSRIQTDCVTYHFVLLSIHFSLYRKEASSSRDVVRFLPRYAVVIVWLLFCILGFIGNLFKPFIHPFICSYVVRSFAEVCILLQTFFWETFVLIFTFLDLGLAVWFVRLTDWLVVCHLVLLVKQSRELSGGWEKSRTHKYIKPWCPSDRWWRYWDNNRRIGEISAEDFTFVRMTNFLLLLFFFGLTWSDTNMQQFFESNEKHFSFWNVGVHTNMETPTNIYAWSFIRGLVH